ncbi:hypothetical protein VP1G_05190 [Cytospora mali]|uniref:Major facilitator superfamily (MFS) profile domain-containing protein n=1 Tax=Cytospora mali TaxID=578113 RepID=A0A194V1N5_CYTMA|nr:hypothetical protein VP1G_05190 [Valsa mali var. pyri (nom. inval.)]
MARPEPTIHDQTNILPTGRLLIVFSALASALLITFIDQQSIGVILPTIGKDLNSSATITWAGTSSLIANTAFQVLYGRLSDIFGRKIIIITCLGLLGLGDLLCSFAQTGPQFFAFRGISGVASGGVMALTMMVVSDVTTLKDRGKFMGILGSCVGMGNAVGPFISSAFTEKVTWRGLFWLLCPMAVCSGLILYVLLPSQMIPPEPLKVKLGKIDYLGVFFSSAGTIILLIPVSGIGTQFPASSPMAISMLTIGSFLIVMFGLTEWKLAKLPMFPLRLFKKPALAAMMAQNFLIGLAYYSLMYYLPLFYQIARQMSVIQSALLILPLVLSQSFASIASGQYMSRTNRYGELIWLGFSLWLAGASSICNFSRTFPLAGIIVTLIVQGLGVGFTFQPILVAAQAHSPKKDRAIIISSRNFLRSLGGAVGLAIASALFSNTLVNRLPSPPAIPQDVMDKIKSSVFSVPDLTGLNEDQENMILDTYVKASRSVFYFWVGCIGLCWLLMWFIKDKGLQRKEERVEAEQDTKNQERREDEESGSTTASGDDEAPVRDEEKPAAHGVVTGEDR